MKKIILISLFLIILAVGGLFAYVSQIDWNTQKEKLSAQMSDIIGKKIQFSGNLQVNLLPHPQLSAKDVHILNSATGDKLATIKQLETEVSLTSLLKGKPDIKSLLLKGVEVWVTFDKDGICNWRQKSKQDTFANDNTFNLRDFNIQKSIVHFDHKKYDVAFDLTGFNADVIIGGYDGPYRVDGSFLKDNDRYGVALNIDALTQLEDVGMSLVITHPRTESNLRYDGTYNISADGIKGDFSGQSQKTADFVNSLFNKKLMRNEYNQPMMFSTTIQSDIEGESLSNLVIKYDKIMEGAGDVVISPESKNKKRMVNVKYQLVKLNVLPFRKMIEEYLEKYQKGEKYEPDVDFDVSYDISSERVTVSDEPSGVFESVSIKGKWEDNIFSIDDFYAACPGNIVLNLKASLTENESMPEYYLGAKINGQNALSFINALGVKIKAPRQSSYRDIDLSFDLHGNPQYLEVEGIDLKMDKAAISGNIAADLLNKEYTINANADILNLDNYIMPREPVENVQTSDVLVAEINRLKWLGGNRTAIEVKAKSATFGGVSARNINIDLVTDGAGTVVVERAAADSLLGTDFDISAVVHNWGRSDLIFDDVTFNVKSQGIKLLADKWQIKLPKWPLFERSNIAISGTLLGNLQKVAVNSLVKSGEHSFRYDGMLNDDNNRLNFAGDILVKTEHLESMLKLLLGDVNGKMYRGPLVANAEVKGDSKNWEASHADIQMGSDKYTANVKIDEEKKVYKVSGSVYTTYLNLVNWINVQKTKSIPKFGTSGDDTFLLKPELSGDVINYNGYRSLALDIDLSAEKSSYGEYTMNNMQTHVTNGQNVLRFQNLKFDSKYHKVKGDLQIDYAQTPQMSGSLIIEYPEIKNLGGSVYAISAGDVIINTEFETSAVTISDMVEGLKGKMSVSGNTLTIKGIDLAAIKDDLQHREYSKGLYQAVRNNTQVGGTSFEKFVINSMMDGGVLTFSPFIIKNADTVVNVNGSVNLKEWKLNDTFKIRYPDLKEIPSYTLNFSGMMNKPTIDINIKEIADKYDKHWAEIEQERLRQQEIIRQQKADKLEEVRGIIAEAEEKATTALQEIEDSMSRHFTETVAEKYNLKSKEISDVNAQLEEIKSKLTANLDDAEIEQMRNDAIIRKQQIETVRSEAQDLFIEDVELEKEEMSSRENDVYNQIKDIYEKFHNMWQDGREQLEQYNSLEYIDGNEELNKNYSNLNENKNEADGIHSDIDNQYNQYSALGGTEDKYVVIQNIDNLLKHEDDIYSQMDTIYNETSDILLKIIGERRVAYEAEKREEEEARRKQAELDAQNLLISDDSNPVTENTGISDENTNLSLSGSDAEVKQDKESAQAVVKSAPGISGKIITQYDKKAENEEQSTHSYGGLLTPIGDDAPVKSENLKVSGSIKVK